MIWPAVAIVLILFAWVFQLSLLSYAMYVLLAVLLASRYLARQWTKQLFATRNISNLQAKVGDVITVSLEIENRGLWPVAWLLMEDLLPRFALITRPPRLQVTGERLKLAMLGSKMKKSSVYQITCQRRGYFQIGPLLLETGDVFGLHRRHIVQAEPEFLTVMPKLIPLDVYELASKRPVGEVRMTYRIYEDPTRIAGVRRYAAGDSLNRVHWRATARTGELQSKVYEPSCIVGINILLDFHEAAHDPKHEPVRSELAITTAASLANAVYLMGQQVGFISNGRDAADRIRAEGWAYDAKSRSTIRNTASMMETNDRLRPILMEARTGPEQLDRIFHTLARLELTDGLSLTQLIQETEGRISRDATIVAIVPNTNAETVLALVNLKKRGFAVTALLNIYDDLDFTDAAIPLIAAGIDTRHLREEASIATICHAFTLT
jgi:uncharacterized protein (DUF58 family)